MTSNTTIVSTFADETVAGKAMAALRDEGFPESAIEILKDQPDRLVSELVKRGFKEDAAREFADAAKQGRTLLAASVSEDRADRAASIMERFESYMGREEQGDRSSAGKVEVVEEELVVGKAKSVTGGVRVTSEVEEREVEETVNLREERVSAEQRPADRKLSPDEADKAFEEKTVEVMGTTEEATPKKEARVVGEVEIGKETEEREETVRGTVRKTDVKVEEVDASAKKKK